MSQLTQVMSQEEMSKRFNTNPTQFFAAVPHQIFDYNLSPGAIAVYVTLAKHADWETGECFPGSSAIQKCLEYTVRDEKGKMVLDDDGKPKTRKVARQTVRKYIFELESVGIIKITRERVKAKNGEMHLKNHFKLCLRLGVSTPVNPLGISKGGVGKNSTKGRQNSYQGVGKNLANNYNHYNKGKNEEKKNTRPDTPKWSDIRKEKLGL